MKKSRRRVWGAWCACTCLLLESLACRDPLDGASKVYDLVDEYVTAEVRTPTSRIDFGNPSAGPALITGWSKVSRPLPSGGRALWSHGPYSEIEVFLPQKRDLSLVFRCAVLSKPRSAEPALMAILVNGSAVGEVTVTENLVEYRVPLPASLLKSGENRLRFLHPELSQRSFMGSPALPGPGRSVDDQRMLWDYVLLDPQPSQSGNSSSDPRQSTLSIGCSNRVDYYLDLPLKSTLVVQELGQIGKPGRLQITWKAEGGKERTLLDVSSSAFRRPLRITTAASRGRLSLASLPDGDCGTGDGFVLRGPRILSPSPMPPEVRQEPRRANVARVPATRPNIIVYLIDALRPDHMSCYGYDRETTLRIDSFAQEASLFKDAQAQSPWTRSSVASLFTGLLPQVHSTNGDHDALPTNILTLAKVLKDVGYTSVGIIGNGNVSKVFGFAQGFDQYRYLAYGEKGEIPARSDQIHDAVVSALPSLARNSPFFLYIHTVDPHAPYDPPAHYRQRFAASVEDPVLGSIESILELESLPGAPPPATVEQLIDLYDAEIAANDASFGALIDELDQRQLLDSSVIVLLSDHGEEFYDHGDWTHGKTLYSEMLNIPLLLKIPESHGSRVIDKVVRQIDVMPTLLDLAGVEIPAALQGRSLLPLIASDPYDGWRSTAIAHMDLRGRIATSLIYDTWKVIQPQSPDGNAFPELYERGADPAERNNLAPQRTDLAKFLIATRKAEESKIDSLTAQSVNAIDDEVVRGLKALGYLDGKSP